MAAYIEALHPFLTSHIVISAIFVDPGMVISMLTYLRFSEQWHLKKFFLSCRSKRQICFFFFSFKFCFLELTKREVLSKEQGVSESARG